MKRAAAAVFLAISLNLLWADCPPETTFAAVSSHPRIYLTASKLSALANKASANSSDYSRWKSWIDNGSGGVKDLALIYKITGDASYKTRALTALGTAYSSAPAADCTQASYNFIDNQDAYNGYISDVAIGYDWLYNDLNSTEQSNYRQFLVDRMTCIQGYVSTSSDWTPYANYLLQAMRLLYMSGAAIHGDHASAQSYIDSADSIYTGKLYPTFSSSGAGRGWYGGGPPEGTGYGVAPDMDRIIDYAAMKKSAEGVDLVSGVQFYEDMLKYLMHSVYPTDYKGKMFMSGDYSIENYYGDRRSDGIDSKSDIRKIMLMAAEQLSGTSTAAYAQNFLASSQYDMSVRYENESIIDVLWYDSSAPSSALSGLSTFYHAPGTGAVFMRGGWDNGATWVGLMAGDHFAYHQHVDQGGFQISKYGQLAIKSGNYYCSPRADCMNNYVLRTVAANSLLVYNPSETFSGIRGGDTYRNDGGQRGFSPKTPEPYDLTDWQTNQTYYDTSTVSKAEDSTYYSYASADLTNAYSSKVTKAIRELAFLKPISSIDTDDYVVVFDRVSASNSGYNKKWLLHTIAEPTVAKSDGSTPASTTGLFWTSARQVSGNVATTDGDLIKADDLSGRLFARVVLPSRHTVTKVGGTGYEHWVASEDGGTNHLPSSLGSKYLYGAWRVEVEPGVAATDDQFLVVMHPASTSKTSMAEVEEITSSTGGVVGANIRDSSANRVVVFSSSATGANISGTVEYAYTRSTTDAYHYIFNLAPGASYDVTTYLSGTKRAVKIQAGSRFTASSNGAIAFNINSIKPATVIP